MPFLPNSQKTHLNSLSTYRSGDARKAKCWEILYEVKQSRLGFLSQFFWAYCISRTGPDWTGLVKRGLVKRGLIKRGLEKRRLVKRGLVKRGLVKRGLVKRGLVKIKWKKLCVIWTSLDFSSSAFWGMTAGIHFPKRCLKNNTDEMLY